MELRLTLEGVARFSMLGLPCLGSASEDRTAFSLTSLGDLRELRGCDSTGTFLEEGRSEREEAKGALPFRRTLEKLKGWTVGSKEIGAFEFCLREEFRSLELRFWGVSWLARCFGAWRGGRALSGEGDVLTGGSWTCEFRISELESERREGTGISNWATGRGGLLLTETRGGGGSS